MAPPLWIEAPMVALVEQGNGEWPVLIADQENHHVRIHRRFLEMMFLAGDLREFLALGFILLGIAGSENAFGRRSQHGFQRSRIVFRRSVDQGLGSSFGRIKCFLWRLRRGCFGTWPRGVFAGVWASAAQTKTNNVSGAMSLWSCLPPASTATATMEPTSTANPPPPRNPPPPPNPECPMLENP